MTAADALDAIRTFFVESRDFNGIPVSRLAERQGIPWPDVRRMVQDLVTARKVDLVFASHSGNPHIKRLPDLPVDVQLAKLETDDPAAICAYPSSSGERLRAAARARRVDDG